MILQKQRVIGPGGGANIRQQTMRVSHGGTIKSGIVVGPGTGQRLGKKQRPQSSYRIKDGKLLVNSN